MGLEKQSAQQISTLSAEKLVSPKESGAITICWSSGFLSPPKKNYTHLSITHVVCQLFFSIMCVTPDWLSHHKERQSNPVGLESTWTKILILSLINVYSYFLLFRLLSNDTSATHQILRKTGATETIKQVTSSHPNSPDKIRLNTTTPVRIKSLQSFQSVHLLRFNNEIHKDKKQPLERNLSETFPPTTSWKSYQRIIWLQLSSFWWLKFKICPKFWPAFFHSPFTIWP